MFHRHLTSHFAHSRLVVYVCVLARTFCFLPLCPYQILTDFGFAGLHLTTLTHLEYTQIAQRSGYVDLTTSGHKTTLLTNPSLSLNGLYLGNMQTHSTTLVQSLRAGGGWDAPWGQNFCTVLSQANNHTS